jgi:hypothetical protein
MTPRKYTRADLPVGIFATVRARGGRGAFVARVESFPAGARMAAGINLDTGRRVRFSPARVLDVTAHAGEAQAEASRRRYRRLESNARRADAADLRRRDRFDAACRALFNAHATGNYDTSDGLPPSDRDPSTGAQYGEAI